MLRVRGLTMRYPNGKRALADFNLDVMAGELVVVLGGNGIRLSDLDARIGVAPIRRLDEDRRIDNGGDLGKIRKFS
jgi:ABC-type branched-subunit amino acid transport system ATPase component